MSSVSLREATGALEWEELFATVARPHLTQSWAYNEAKGAIGGVSPVSTHLSIRRLVFERDGHPVALCHVLEKKVAGLTLAARVNRGPLLLGDRPTKDLAVQVYSGLRRSWRHGKRGVLFLAPALDAGDEGDQVLRHSGFRQRDLEGWCSAVLDLRAPEDQLRANLAPTWRNRLRVAERAGLTFDAVETDSSLDWILSRHAENMSAKGFVGPPVSFVRSLCRQSPGAWFVGRASLPGEQESIAGMLVFHYGNTAEYYVGWFGEAGRGAGAGNFLYWQSVLEARRRGYLRFDLGGYSPTSKSEAGLRHFKQGLRGEEYRLANEQLTF